jgi:hypothetical protein
MNTVRHVPHGIFVDVSLLIQGTEVLYQTEETVLFLYHEDGAVVSGSGSLNNSQFQPLFYLLLDGILVSFGYLKLLDIWRDFK